MKFASAVVFLTTFVVLGHLPVIAYSDTRLDLSVDHGSFADPPIADWYTYYVRNIGSRRASNVHVLASLPPGTEFLQVFAAGSVDQSNVRCVTPPAGVRGDLDLSLGTLEVGALVEVIVVVRFTGAAGDDVSLRVDVTSGEPDEDETNNSYRYENFIPFPSEPPTIAEVMSAHDKELGFVLVIRGTQLGGFRREVGLGCDCTPWPQVRELAPDKLILYGGKALRSQFPIGVPVRICVDTAPGGRTVTTFTRR